MSLSRIIAILLSPILVCRLLDGYYKVANWFMFFFGIWYLYASFSLLWTTDIEEATKEMVYYPVHFIFFLEIIVFSFFSSNPLKNIALGWSLGFLATSIVAGWELITDNHLFMTKQKSGLMQNMGNGVILLRHFCSVTFGNYNTYVTYIAFAFPFLLYANAKKFLKRFFSILCLVLPFIFIGQNASRGGIISIMGIFLLFLFFQKKISKKTFFITISIFFIMLYVLSITDSFTVFFYRMGKTSLNDSRLEIWFAAINLWKSTFYIGSGIGSMISSMRLFSTHILITHNLFLEILVQYGFIIFFPIIAYLISCLRRTLKKNDIETKSIVLPALCFLPFAAIIDSGYLLNPVVFAYFASLEVFISYENS